MAKEYPSILTVMNPRTLRIFLLIIVTSGVFFGAMVTGVAASDTSVTRDGDLITIQPGDHNADSTRVRTVVKSPGLPVIGNDGLVYNYQKNKNKSSITINVAGTTSGELKGDLSNVSARIIYGNGNVSKVRTSLYTVKPKSEMPVWTTSDSLYIRVNSSETSGLTDSSNIRVKITDKSEILLADYQSNQNRIVLNRSKLPSVDKLKNNVIKIKSVDGGTISEVELDSEIRSIGSELILWNPLIRANTEYSVTANGESQLVEPEHAGSLPLPVNDAVEVDISVTKSGSNLINTTLETRSPPNIEATYSEGEIKLPPSLNGLMVQSALVKKQNRVISISDDNIEQETIQYSAFSPSDEMLISTPSGLLSITAGSSSSGSIVSMLPLVGVVLLIAGVGVGTGMVGGYSGGTDKSAYAILSFISLTLCLALAISMLNWGFETGIIGGSSENIASYLGVIIGTLGTPVGVFTVDRFLSSQQENISNASVNQTSSNGEMFTPKVSVDGDYDHIEAMKSSDDSFRRIDPNNVTMFEKNVVKAVNGRGEKSSAVEVSADNPHANLRLPAYKTVSARHADYPFEISGVQVSGQEASTGAGNEIRIPSTKERVSVELSHQKFHRKEVEIGRNDGVDGVVERNLEPKTGELAITSTVDDVPAANTELLVQPNGETTEYVSEETVRTDNSGKVTIEKMVGDYTIKHKNSSIGGYYTTNQTSTKLRYNDRAAVTLNVEFEYQLSESCQNKITALREEIDSLTDANYDTSIQNYFTSVPEAFLTTVESIPSHGELFFENELSPEETAMAILDANEELLEEISEAMSTKRNIDLFTACEDMANREVSWSHPNLLESVVSYVTEKAGKPEREMKKDVKQNYERVEEVISDERQTVNEISPVEETHDRVIQLLGSGEKENERVVSAFVTQRMLDAIEEFFEHEALRKRLDRTVF